jgi:EAL domain-containing protein (putative c-di-GMP-specific phosphodiesterase class I)
LALKIGVNVSVTDLLDVGLVDFLEDLMQAHRLPASSVVLEVTEEGSSLDRVDFR